MNFCTRWIKLFLLITLGFIIVYKLLSKTSHHSDMKGPVEQEQGWDHSESQEIFRVFHLDLKGAPPKLEYLKQVVPLIKEAGATAILIEYEDMFPFVGSIQNISATNCYKRSELKSFLSFVKDLDLEIIPLVQTFGHMEYVLKLDGYQHLRELPSFPQELCPSNSDSFKLIQEILKQVMEFHPNAKYIHIGCDEVYHLAACNRCSRQSPKHIFLEHVTRVAQYVRDTYPGVTPLIWDDMLRKWSPEDLDDIQLADLVEPVVWCYASNIINLIPHYIWYGYTKTFKTVWIASAFKGASGETEVLPKLSNYVNNHLAWIELIRMRHANFPKIKGIMVTGWSRYDHFAVLCEVLPVSIPSLLLNLIIIQESFHSKHTFEINDNIITKWQKLLNCPARMKTDKLAYVNIEQISLCYFPGSNLYNLFHSYLTMKIRYDKLYEEYNKNGWLQLYQIKHNYTSPYRVLESFPSEGLSGVHLKNDLIELSKYIGVVMSQYFDNYTIAEWTEQKITYLITFLNELEKNSQNLVKRQNWERRPLRIT